MSTKKRILLSSYYLPGIVVLIRIFFTAWTFYSNPLGLRLLFIQVVPLCVLLGSCFGHFKLYRDGVPVISLMTPNILHFILIIVFYKKVMIVPFLPIVIPDILYLVVKSVKANLFPFYVEGEDDDIDYEELAYEVTRQNVAE